MKVVILAAGFGSRFGDRNLPKPLTELSNSRSILELQIDRLSTVFSFDDIILVVGYHKEEIIDRFPDFLFVYNNNFANENTSKSLLRAVNKIDDDLLWLNGDVVFHPNVLKAILEAQSSAMIVNKGPVGDEEVKYRTKNGGRIIEVSKKVEKPEGEALGINLCLKKDLPLFRKKLQLCKPQDYFERALEMAIYDGMDVQSVVVEDSQCVEIDFEEDLTKANKLLASW